MDKINKIYCCLCGKDITNEEKLNPAPLTIGDGSKCCKDCYEALVIPKKLELSAISKFD